MMSPEPESERPSTGSEASSLINAIRVVRERWWLILITAVVGFVVALGAALHSTKQYTATSTLLVRPSNLPALIDPTQTQANDSSTLARIQADDVSLVTSTSVAQQARVALRTSATTGDLLGEVTATAGSTNDLIDIQVTDSDPSRAARIANAFAAATVTYLTGVRSGSARRRTGQAAVRTDRASGLGPGWRPALEQGLKQVIALRAVTNGGASVAKTGPTSRLPRRRPSVKRDAIVGGVAGLVIGLIIIFLRDLFDRRLKTEEAIEGPLRPRRADRGAGPAAAASAPALGPARPSSTRSASCATGLRTCSCARTCAPCS